MKKLLLLGMSSAFAFSASAQTLEERVEALEYAGYEDIFRFSGQLELMYATSSEEDNENDTKASGQAWRSWLKLDMEAKPSDKMTFYGRLSMAKFVNRMSNYTDGTLGDVDGQLDEGQNPKGSEVFIERAFVNYQASDKLVFTMGRMPTANGSPYHLTRNESSGGAYPLLSYNAFFDGGAVSYNLMDSLSVKFIYTPFQFFMPTNATTGQQTTTTSGDTVETPSDIYSVMLDYDKEGFSFARRFKATFQYLRASRLAFDIDDTDGSGNATQTDMTVDISRVVLNTEFYGLFGSDIDLAVQAMTIASKTNNKLVRQVGAGVTNDFYFLSDDGSEVTGQTFIMTARYNINNSNKVGLEYTTSTEGVFSSDVVSKTPIEFYGLPGHGYHVFYNRAFEGGLNMIVGAYQTQRDYEAPLADTFGERDDADVTTTSIYTNFIANF